MISPAKIYSILGNPKALAPLGVKDGANCLGQTASSYVTGKKEEAQDRFIDEVGTEAIWLGGIPLFKKVIDKTIFKAANLDAKYDIRNLENKDIFEKTKQHAPTDKIAQGIDKIGKNAKAFKGLSVAKVLLATAATFVSYDALTNLKQKYTEKKVKAKILQEMEQKNSMDSFVKKAETNGFIDSKNSHDYPTFSSIKNHSKNNNSNPTFKGGMANFILDPVKNMYVLDGGITTQRLDKSRSPQEFAGYAIKEGGFLFFMYYAGQKIQEHFEKTASKHHGKSIRLDATVIEDEKFKQAFKDGSIEQSLKEFPDMSVYQNYEQNKPTGFVDKIKNFFEPKPQPEEIQKKDAEIFEFLFSDKAKNNKVIDVAKKSNVIQMYGKTDKIDTRKFVDIESLRGVHKHISKLYSQYKASGEDVDSFFNGVRHLKRASIKKNMGISMLALGVLLPGAMLAQRLLSNDKEFAVKKQMREQLEKENKAKQANAIA